MEQKLVGREVELEDLNKYLNSEKSEKKQKLKNLSSLHSLLPLG